MAMETGDGGGEWEQEVGNYGYLLGYKLLLEAHAY